MRTNKECTGVRGTRQGLPTGFMRRDPAPASHLTLIKLAELLRDLFQGLTVSTAGAQAITELVLQGAWHRLSQRRQGKPDPLAPWHW